MKKFFLIMTLGVLLASCNTDDPISEVEETISEDKIPVQKHEVFEDTVPIPDEITWGYVSQRLQLLDERRKAVFEILNE